jgi:pheromone shutdown-related protein TraB
MQMQNLTIIGSSHIAKQSCEQVQRTILEKKPEIVAVELDARRLYSLTHKQKKSMGLGAIKQIGFSGYMFTVIGGFVQKRLGKMVGMEPGAEMMLAVKLAKQNKLKLCLIDQDIAITMKRFTKTLTWKEKFNFIGDIFNGIFFRKREMKRFGVENLDLTKVPSKTLIKIMMKKLKSRYPNIYKTLIEERNEVMADNIVKIMEANPNKKIVAVVGAGHEDELLRLVHIKTMIDRKSLAKTIGA